MPKWLDENTIKGELSNIDFIKSVMDEMRVRVEKEQKKGRPGDYGNDGFIQTYEESQTHNGIKYQLKVLRYFAVTRLLGGHFELRLREGHCNKIGKHVVVENDYPEVPYQLKEILSLDEFLYHDSLHAGMEAWTLREQWEEMERWAQADCKRVESLPSQFDKRVKELQKQLIEFLQSIKDK